MSASRLHASVARALPFIALPWLIGADVAAQGPLRPVARFACSLAKNVFWPQSFAKDRRYFEPLIAEPRAAQVNAILGSARSVPFLQHQPRMAMWDIDVGAELPLWGGARQCLVDSTEGRGNAGLRGHVGLHQWGFGLWFPIDFHMMESLNDPTAPILSTDYRFNAMIKGEYVYAQGQGTEHRFAVRARGGHESTHLGDEYTLRSSRAAPSQFERINVSYEYLDVALGLNGSTNWGYYASHFGVVHTVKPWRRSYYDVDSVPDLTVSPLGPVTPTRRDYEPYLGGEVMRESLDWHVLQGTLLTSWLSDWSGYVSVDLRDKTIYNYHKSSAAAPDATQWSTNLVVGIHPQGNAVVSYEGRVYYGVNPHGQFRNQKNFTLVGFGLHLNSVPIP